MSNFKKFILIPLSALVVLSAALYFVFISPYNAVSPLILHEIPDFQLTDSNNQTFGKSQLMGNVWVANFVFTSCSAVCPRMTAKMQNLARSYEREGEVHFVSITVDPDNDTPDRLAEYAKSYGIDTKKWHFLTGVYEDIHAVAANGFKVGKVDEPIFHSEKMILVDQNAHVRGYYDFDDAKAMKRLFHDIALVLKEKK